MKYLYLKLFLSLLASVVFTTAVTAQTTYFRKEYAYAGESVSTCSQISTFDGGILLFQQTYSGSLKYISLIKTDLNGVVQWNKCLGPMQIAIKDIVQLPDSGFVFSYSEFTGSFCYQVMKLDQSGNVVFSRRIDPSPPFLLRAIPQVIPRSNGNFYLCGDLLDTVTYLYSPLLAEMDSSGNILWSKQYVPFPGKNNHVDFDTCANGDVVILHNYDQGVSTAAEPMIIRTDPQGNLLWIKTYSFTGQNLAGARLEVMPGDHFVISAIQYFQTVLFRTDGNGNVEWAVSYSVPNQFLEPLSMCKAENSGVVITGKCGTTGFFIRCDSLGQQGCENAYQNLIPYSVSHLSSNEYCVAAINMNNAQPDLLTVDPCGNSCVNTQLSIQKNPMALSTTSYQGDTAITLIASACTVPSPVKALQQFNICTITGATEQDTENGFELFPNPAASAIQINAGQIIEKAEVVDAQGRIVLAQSFNTNIALLDVSNLDEGLYCVRIYSGSQVSTQKIIIQNRN